MNLQWLNVLLKNIHCHNYGNKDNSKPTIERIIYYLRVVHLSCIIGIKCLSVTTLSPEKGLSRLGNILNNFFFPFRKFRIIKQNFSKQDHNINYCRRWPIFSLNTHFRLSLQRRRFLFAFLSTQYRGIHTRRCSSLVTRRRLYTRDVLNGILNIRILRKV